MQGRGLLGVRKGAASIGRHCARGMAHESVSLDMAEMSVGQVYRLMIESVVPRPIAFVSSYSSSLDKHNLAPFSYFNAVSSRPPVLMFSVTRNPDGSKKDTLKNIEESGGFVVNIASSAIAEQLNACAAAVRGPLVFPCWVGCSTCD